MPRFTLVYTLVAVMLLAACGATAQTPLEPAATVARENNDDQITTSVAATLIAISVQETITAIAMELPATEVDEATPTSPAMQQPTSEPLPEEQPVAYRDVAYNGNIAPGDGSGNVAGGITITGAPEGPDTEPVVSGTFAIQVAARVPETASSDGEGVESVAFRIEKPNGTYEHIEVNAGYCSFGGGEPTCNLQELDDDWPDGSYFVSVAIQPKDSVNETIFWNFQFIIRRA